MNTVFVRFSDDLRTMPTTDQLITTLDGTPIVAASVYQFDGRNSMGLFFEENLTDTFILSFPDPGSLDFYNEAGFTDASPYVSPLPLRVPTFDNRESATVFTIAFDSDCVAAAAAPNITLTRNGFGNAITNVTVIDGTIKITATSSLAGQVNLLTFHQPTLLTFAGDGDTFPGVSLNIP